MELPCFRKVLLLRKASDELGREVFELAIKLARHHTNAGALCFEGLERNTNFNQARTRACQELLLAHQNLV